jgi:phosphoribosylformimino-5-aminoimidazole carboxamide ribotide isomerase
MHILPVLDLLNGVVVRGVGGIREEYRPVVSRLVGSPDVLSVARTFRDQLGLTRLYVADLDAILHQRPNREIYSVLANEGFELLVDAGLRNVESAESVLAAGATSVIAGLETWPGPDELAVLCRAVGTDRAIFSLDLKHGRPLGDLSRWRTVDPLAIAIGAVETGIEELVVLDLGQVGIGGGVTTTDLCRRLLDSYPNLSVVTGGGVRDAADLETLAAARINGVLVASALHDGRLTREDVQRYSQTGHPV